MIKITIESPTVCFIENASSDEISRMSFQLTYEDTSAIFALKKLKENKWLQSYKPETFKNRKEELEKKAKTCMLNFCTDSQKHWFHPGSISYLKNFFNFDIKNNIKYPEFKKIAWTKLLPFELYPYQKQSVENLLKAKHGCVELCTGCHIKGQKILMFDGSLKKVEDIVVGDLLMGPDSNSRKVLALHRGKEKMAKIIPTKGDPFVVNMGHILSLQRTNNKSEYNQKKKRRKDFNGKNPIVNISVKEYLKQTKSFKHRYKLYRTGVCFEKKHELSIDPYILGLWLGDGSSSGPSLTAMDNEVKQKWLEYAEYLGLKIREEIISENNKAKTFHIYSAQKNKGSNIFRNNLKKYNLINNKHIPEVFKTSSHEVRLKILAGLVDSDGYLGKKYYEIIQKNKKLADDIAYLARSIGFAAYVKKCIKKSQTNVSGEYYRITISGDIHTVPVLLKRKKATPRKQIKNVLRTGFKIEELEEDDYFGFEVDKDNLYLMDDFTVTHNSGKTAIILTLARELGLKTIVVTPSKSIFLEILEKFEHHLGKSNVGAYGDGKKKIGKNITVCVSKSLTTIVPGSKEHDFFANADVVISDESHLNAAETLETVFHGLLKNVPYRFFLSGTQIRGDGKDELLQAIIGKKVFSLNTKQAVEGKYICPVKFIVFETISKDSKQYKDPLKAKRNQFLYNENICEIAAKIANSAWNHANESTLILVEELEQIKMLKDKLKVPFDYVHSASKADAAGFGLETKKVDEIVELFNKGQVKVLIGTSCIATGTNIYPTHNTINWVGGASEVKTKQGAVGRSVRILENSIYKDLHKPKPYSKIYDFRITNISLMEIHFQKRVSIYKETSSDIKYIKV
jgi:superfamily II DNA or RNA helicase